MNNKLLILLGILVAIFLVSGCVQEQTEREIPFETIEKGEYSNFRERANLVIHDGETFRISGVERVRANAFLKRVCGQDLGNVSCEVIPPVIDFSSTSVIAVFMGEQTSGGYSIEITKIVDYGNKVIVYVNETSPAPGQDVTGALTQPYHIIKTEKITKGVEFQEQNVKSIDLYLEAAWTYPTVIMNSNLDFETSILHKNTETIGEHDQYTTDSKCRLSGEKIQKIRNYTEVLNYYKENPVKLTIFNYTDLPNPCAPFNYSVECWYKWPAHSKANLSINYYNATTRSISVWHRSNYSGNNVYLTTRELPKEYYYLIDEIIKSCEE